MTFESKSNVTNNTTPAFTYGLTESSITYLLDASQSVQPDAIEPLVRLQLIDDPVLYVVAEDMPYQYLQIENTPIRRMDEFPAIYGSATRIYAAMASTPMVPPKRSGTQHISYYWFCTGHIRYHRTRGLEFPTLPIGAGVYRIEIAHSRRLTVYVGESKVLRERITSGYGGHSTNSPTNVRIRAAIVEALRSRRQVTISLMTDLVLYEGGGPVLHDLTDMYFRREVEKAALFDEIASGHAALNLHKPVDSRIQVIGM